MDSVIGNESVSCFGWNAAFLFHSKNLFNDILSPSGTVPITVLVKRKRFFSFLSIVMGLIVLSPTSLMFSHWWNSYSNFSELIFASFYSPCCWQPQESAATLSALLHFSGSGLPTHLIVSGFISWRLKIQMNTGQQSKRSLLRYDRRVMSLNPFTEVFLCSPCIIVFIFKE